ncbi:MAG: uroporphyrinogen decarboxylase family protein [Chloroflexota bacterium]
MVQSSKELVRSLFQLRELAKVPFIPWVCSFAAQLEQVEVETMLSDAGSLSRALINSQKLFGYDAIVNVFDPSLEAEACGCKVDWSQAEALPKVVSHPLSEGAKIEDIDISNFEKRGRLPAILEATKRLNIIRGKEVAIIGLITGPLTLARHLKGETFVTDLNQGAEEAKKVIALAGNVGLKLCRTYCELGVDVIVIAEEMLGQIKPNQYQAVAAPLRSIWNVARFYNVHSLLLSKGCHQEHIEPILALQSDGVALTGDIDYTYLMGAALKRKCCYARSIPGSALLGTLSQVKDSTLDCLSSKGRGFFLSTEWEVPYATDVNNTHEVMRVILDGRSITEQT